ncbi:MAG: aromatic ring-hydroxylating oxygenase subunit alpha [Burkholderiales bacterium]
MAAGVDDLSVVQRVLEHVAAGTTDTGDTVWREPVANYTSPERLAAELALMRSTAVPFCPSAAILNPGDYLARTTAGVPLLVVRGNDGVVRAFRNACRHRGMQVAQGAGSARSFVCPYHAWTYALDGTLRHIPHDKGFPGLNREQHGLVPVHAEEKYGLIFVTQVGAAPGAIDEYPQMLKPGAQLFDYVEREIEGNWKVLLEASLEGYHIRYAHAETFYPYGYDNLNLIDFFGRGSRVTFPFRRIEKLADRPAEARQVEGRVTYVWHLFPNAHLTQLSSHTNLTVQEPTGVGTTRQMVWSMSHGAGEEALAAAKHDRAFVSETGLIEDRNLVAGIQRSIGSGANDAFTFGHYESAIVHLHRGLRDALEGRP